MECYTLLWSEFLHIAHMCSGKKPGADCRLYGSSAFAKDEVKAGGSASTERADHAADGGEANAPGVSPGEEELAQSADIPDGSCSDYAVAGNSKIDERQVYRLA